MIYTAAFTERDSECFLKNTVQMLKCWDIKNKEKNLEKKPTRINEHGREELITLFPV